MPIFTEPVPEAWSRAFMSLNSTVILDEPKWGSGRVPVDWIGFRMVSRLIWKDSMSLFLLKFRSVFISNSAPLFSEYSTLHPICYKCEKLTSRGSRVEAIVGVTISIVWLVVGGIFDNEARCSSMFNFWYSFIMRQRMVSGLFWLLDTTLIDYDHSNWYQQKRHPSSTAISIIGKRSIWYLYPSKMPLC